MNDYNQLKTALQALGFSEKESSVYISLLELGKGTVSQISRKAGINRTTGYEILDSLINIGVVNLSGKEPKSEYSAEPPKSLIDHLQKMADDAMNRIKKAQEFIPQLLSVYAVQNRPRIKFYEGTEGLKRVYEDTLTSSEPIRAFATVDDMHNALPNYFPDYYKRRAGKNISIRAIVPKTQAGDERREHDKEEKREIAFIPSETYYFTPEINIYDNKVMIASWKEKLGIMIESAEIADAMKKMYELAWNEAKRLNNQLGSRPQA
ncbi:MAG: helix-turn-helix domain-containing protein [Candidatus Paceibacterota bacterium]|jgi:sugar-specific transcriptional regulator TrmB